MVKLSEHSEQCAVFDWAATMAATYPELDTMFAIPNGGLRNISVAMKLKAEGVKAGIPDICLPTSHGGYHALYIELKVKPNKPTEQQLVSMSRLADYGNLCVVCYGADEAIQTIMAYIKADPKLVDLPY